MATTRYGVPKIYGMDCFTPLAWIGAHTERINLGTSIMQISARTPASAAMHAVALDHLSNGRLILGIGVSGPQVVEGWYGMPYPKPLARTREWLTIFRRIIAREGPVSFDGEHYQLPLPGGTGLGKPLKLMQHPLRDHIPVYLGAEGPKNVALAAEICDGWIPMFLSPYRMMDQYSDAMRIRKPDFEIAAAVPVVVDDDVDRARAQIKQNVGVLRRRDGREIIQRAQGSREPHGLRRRRAGDPGPVHGRKARSGLCRGTGCID